MKQADEKQNCIKCGRWAGYQGDCSGCAWDAEFCNTWYRKLWYTNLQWRGRGTKKFLKLLWEYKVVALWRILVQWRFLFK